MNGAQRGARPSIPFRRHPNFALWMGLAAAYEGRKRNGRKDQPATASVQPSAQGRSQFNDSVALLAEGHQTR